MQPQIVDAVLFGADEAVVAFVRERLPWITDFGPCVALGIVRDERLIGGAVFHNWDARGFDIEMSMAVDPCHWGRPRTVARVLRYPFVQLGCNRISLRTGKRNRRAREAALKAGFHMEGVKRRALDGREDQILYGMLRSECRYLKGL